jgi:two-component system sensor histidine kinase KdpD
MRLGRPAPRSPADLVVGVLAGAGAVALVSSVIDVLRPIAPVLSLGVLYVLAVVPVAVLWGLGLATAVSVASLLAFNWFFLPPTHTFSLRDSQNWVALAVYLVTGVVVSALAARARRRAAEARQREREAAALAAVAGDLLRGVEVGDELGRVAQLAADVLGAEQARLEPGVAVPTGGERAYELGAAGRTVGTLLLARGRRPPAGVAERFLPALASLLAVALDRAELEREALEAGTLRRSDAVKTTVLRAVSHDLRSPLTAIAAAASGLASADLTLDEADRASLVETIRVEAGRLDRVVGNLLDLSRLEAGVASPAPEIWTLDELLGQSLEQVGADGDRVKVDLAADLPLVRVDAVQVERVLVNLIENALKFSSADAVVRVRAEPAAGELLVHVVDSGPGIPVADRERVFEPFARGAGAGGRGAGLGLAIARGFAEANRARLWAADGPGGHLVLALPALQPARLEA